jgi:hypothetical protein
MNIIKFVNNELMDARKKQLIVNELKQISKHMKGRACFNENLSLGQSSSFLIFCLIKYFKKNNLSFNSYLEVGTLFGGSLCALYASGYTGIAYSIDIFTGYYGNFDDVSHTPYPKGYEKNHAGHIQIVHDNVSRYGGDPICIVGNTQKQEFLEKIPNLNIEKLDVLYIDGDHSYKGAISDYNAFVSYLKKDGILLVDNFEMKGVQNAVVEMLREHASTITPLGVWNSTTWIGIKR